jgi:hypothetical protein
LHYAHNVSTRFLRHEVGICVGAIVAADSLVNSWLRNPPPDIALRFGKPRLFFHLNLPVS